MEEFMGSAFAISTTPGPASSRVERMIRINVIRFFLAMSAPVVTNFYINIVYKWIAKSNM